jgi:hypothetical protein
LRVRARPRLRSWRITGSVGWLIEEEAIGKRLSHYCASRYAELPFVLRIVELPEKEEIDQVLALLAQASSTKKDGFKFVDQTETEVANPEPEQAFEQPAPEQVEEPAQKIALVEPKTKLPPLITDDRRLLPSNEAEAIILTGLQNAPGFPTRGATVTVYGFRPWNAMLTFAPGCTSHNNARMYRELLIEIVCELRTRFEIDVNH